MAADLFRFSQNKTDSIFNIFQIQKKFALFSFYPQFPYSHEFSLNPFQIILLKSHAGLETRKFTNNYKLLRLIY